MSAGVRDILVIGSGIGGLTAGALAARDGLDVLVVEGHTRPGGCASDFYRRGLLFPAGATLVSGFEEGGLHRWVYEQLDVPPRVQRLDLAMTVHLPDREVRVPTRTDAWAAERRRAFPRLGRGGEQFWRRIGGLAGQAHALASARPTLPITSLGEIGRAAALARPGLVTTLPALWSTVGALLRQAGIAGDRAHRRFVDGQLLISMQCEADECVALNGALALELYRYGCFSVTGGTAGIAADLVRSLTTRGGSIRFRSWVRSLAPADGLWHATTAAGERLLARAVVANLPAANLAELLGPHCPPVFARRARTADDGWGAAMLYVAIDAVDLPDQLPGYHQTLARYDAPLEDGNSCFVSVFPPEQTGRPGVGCLTVSTHTRVEPWWGLTDRDAYAERKAAYGERLLAAAEIALPEIRRRIRFSEVATPRSFWRWTGRHEGRVGGVPQTRAHANFAALSHRVGPPGLFICGDTVFPGQGTIGVTLSGINAYRDASAHARSRRRSWASPDPRAAVSAGR